MRALSVRQAARCETAFFDKCRCRCGGKFHGARRVLDADRERFEALAEDDPHHIPTEAEKRLARKLARIRAADARSGQASLPLEA
jgi:hypothetical protein